MFKTGVAYYAQRHFLITFVENLLTFRQQSKYIMLLEKRKEDIVWTVYWSISVSLPAHPLAHHLLCMTGVYALHCWSCGGRSSLFTDNNGREITDTLFITSVTYISMYCQTEQEKKN